MELQADYIKTLESFSLSLSSGLNSVCNWVDCPSDIDASECVPPHIPPQAAMKCTVVAISHWWLSFRLRWCGSAGLGLAVHTDSLTLFPEMSKSYQKLYIKHTFYCEEAAFSELLKLCYLSSTRKKRMILSSASESPVLLVYFSHITVSWHVWPSFRPRWPQLPVSSQLYCHFSACQRTSSGFPC